MTITAIGHLFPPTLPQTTTSLFTEPFLVTTWRRTRTTLASLSDEGKLLLIVETSLPRHPGHASQGEGWSSWSGHVHCRESRLGISRPATDWVPLRTVDNWQFSAFPPGCGGSSHWESERVDSPPLNSNTQTPWPSPLAPSPPGSNVTICRCPTGLIFSHHVGKLSDGALAQKDYQQGSST